MPEHLSPALTIFSNNLSRSTLHSPLQVSLTRLGIYPRCVLDSHDLEGWQPGQAECRLLPGSWQNCGKGCAQLRIHSSPDKSTS